MLAGGPADTRALWAGGGWFAQLGLIAGVWLLLGPAWTAAAPHLRRGSPRDAGPVDGGVTGR